MISVRVRGKVRFGVTGKDRVELQEGSTFGL